MSGLTAESHVDSSIQPTADELRLAYRMAVRSRSTEEHIVRLASRGEVKFAIWGPGEEVHGTATALPDRNFADALNRHRTGCGRCTREAV